METGMRGEYASTQYIVIKKTKIAGVSLKFLSWLGFSSTKLEQN